MANDNALLIPLQPIPKSTTGPSLHPKPRNKPQPQCSRSVTPVHSIEHSPTPPQPFLFFPKIHNWKTTKLRKIKKYRPCLSLLHVLGMSEKPLSCFLPSGLTGEARVVSREGMLSVEMMGFRLGSLGLGKRYIVWLCGKRSWGGCLEN